jgi:hypothetical protein
VSYVIKAVAFANGEPCPHAGQYVESFDHEHANGQGWGDFTSDVAKAKKFPNKVAAFAFWLKVPKCRKYRPDGQLNKPLTSLTVSIEPVEDSDAA